MSAAVEPILFVSSDIEGPGGIARYSRWLRDALVAAGPTEVVDVRFETPAERARQALAAARRVLSAPRSTLVVLGHVGFGPLGWLHRARGGRFAVVAYGIEVWGRPSREVDVTLRLAEAIWPISTFTARQVRSRVPRARIARSLGGGLQEAFFVSPRPAATPFRVLVVSRLDDLVYKGVDTCVDAVAELLRKGHELELRVVGSGPCEHEIDELAANRGIADHVVRVGSVSDEQLRAEYAEAGVTVLVSRFRRGRSPQGEGLGIVVLEAAAAGTPAIVARVGGTVDTVLDGETGFIVDAGDADALAERIERLLCTSGLRERIGTRARRWVAEVHGEAAFRRRVEEALRRGGR